MPKKTEQSHDQWGCSNINDLGSERDYHSKVGHTEPSPRPPVYRIKGYTYFIPNSPKDSYLGSLKAESLPRGATALIVNFNGHASPGAYMHDGMIELVFSLSNMWELTRKISCPEHPLFLLWDKKKMRAGLGITQDKWTTIPISSLTKPPPDPSSTTCMFGLPKNNPNALRIIKTARTADDINAAVEAGMTPVLKPVEPGRKIHNMVGVYQDRSTKKIKLSGDLRWGPGEEYELVLPHRTYYPYTFPAPFAAYLLPSDLPTGERVWIEDIIEDIVAVWGNQGYNPRLKCAEATWNGHDFTIHFDPDKDAPRLVG